jgi:hypothetical protein
LHVAKECVAQTCSGSSARAARTMVNVIVPIESPHLTKRALDAGESARFLAFSLPQLFSRSDGILPSAPAQVTLTVRWHAVVL